MSWRKTHAVASTYEERVLRATRRLLSSGVIDGLEQAVESGSVSQVIQTVTASRVQVVETGRRQIRTLMLTILDKAGARASLTPERGLRTARRTKTVVGFEFEKVSPDAVRWASQHAAELVTNISADQEAVLRQIVAGGFRKQATTKVLAERIRRVVGLTIPQLSKYERLLEEVGRREARTYAARARTERARTIARTETLRASNEGTRQAWKQAKDQGYLTGTETREWITTPDDRLCPICLPLDGEVVGLDEVFSVGVMTPPAHPRCRCAIGLSMRERSQKEAA